MPDSSHHRDLQTKPHNDGSQPRSAGHFEMDPPSDTTTSASLATPPVSSSSPTRPFASPLPATSFTKKRDSTRKKLKLRAKPRRKLQDQRRSTCSQSTLEGVDSAATASRSSRREPTSVAVPQHEEVEGLTEPAEVRTPPVMPSSQASLSPRHTSVADVHQRLTNKEVQARRGYDIPRDEDRTSHGETTDRPCQTPSNQSQQEQTSGRVSNSNNKENELPSPACAAPKTSKIAEFEGQTQPKRTVATSFSQAARSGRAKHKSKKKIGTTVRLDPCLHCQVDDYGGHDLPCLNVPPSP